MTGSDSNAKQYALKLLSYKGRSEREIEERLRKKGVSSEVISSTMHYLKDAGFIDDRLLAEALKREALTHRMLSRAGARHFILRRGIPRRIVDSIFRDSEDTDRENALRLADKKLRILGRYPRDVAKRRLYNLLLRRGYSSGMIIKVLQEKMGKEEV